MIDFTDTRKEKFNIKGTGNVTTEFNINTERFIEIWDRTYSVKNIAAISIGQAFGSPIIDISFLSGHTEHIPFQDVEDRNLCFSYFKRWLTNDDKFNYFKLEYVRGQKNEDN